MTNMRTPEEVLRDTMDVMAELDEIIDYIDELGPVTFDDLTPGIWEVNKEALERAAYIMRMMKLSCTAMPTVVDQEGFADLQAVAEEVFTQ